MKFVGGKFRLKSAIKDLVLSARNGRPYYLEPFCGGMNSFAEIAPYFDKSVAADSHLDLMLLWAAVQRGWQAPTEVSEEQYRLAKQDVPSALRGFVGYTCSFGGKWFGGYARGVNTHGDPRNYANESVKNISKSCKGFLSSQLLCADYRAFSPTLDWVVYCDPPYVGTLGYRDKWNPDAFWDTMREWRDNGARVLISEYSAPDDFQCITEWPHRMSVASAKDRKPTIERVFI